MDDYSVTIVFLFISKKSGVSLEIKIKNKLVVKVHKIGQNYNEFDY